jgi:hypothetical protein
VRFGRPDALYLYVFKALSLVQAISPEPKKVL